MREQISKLKNNPIGLLGGGVAGWFVSKKLIKTESMLVTLLVTGIGAFAGATAQNTWKAKKSQPTVELITK